MKLHKITRGMLGLLALLVTGQAALAGHNGHNDHNRHNRPNQRDAQYESRRRALRSSYKATSDAIRFEYRNSLRALAAAKHEARHLHEPQRSHELDHIRHERRRTVESYRFNKAAAKRNYRLAIERLDAWYAQANQWRRGYTQPACAIERRTTAYSTGYGSNHSPAGLFFAQHAR